jgi:Tfp pilus assembly protein PilX
MTAKRAQAGLTLVVSLIMLVVLTLLVVSAIRFGNINLKIAGNAQTQAEGAAAAQVAIEQTVKAVTDGTQNLSTMVETPTTVSTGGASYKVTVKKPNCNMTKNVDTATLKPATNANDRLCFGQTDPDRLINADGTLTSSPSACKDQQWDLSASVGDDSSGTQVTVGQGVSLRVGAEVSCP